MRLRTIGKKTMKWAAVLIILICLSLIVYYATASKKQAASGTDIGKTNQITQKKEDTAGLKTIIVSQDGNGDFTTVQAAVYAVPSFSKEPIVVRIMNGTYTEKVTVPKTKPFIHFVGESKENTMITYTEITGTGFNVSATTIEADNFTAENMTFANGAGTAGVAVAVDVKGDRETFRNVRFLGYQDTLYLNAAGKRQYYQDCYIEGAVDFIYGSAIAVFNNCVIHNKRSGGYITAASTPQEQKYGIVFLNCKVTGDPGVENVYLGRPWRPYANVAFIHTRLDNIIKPSGWHNWGDPEKEKTARYMELGNEGPGAETAQRVSWSKQGKDDDLQEFSLDKVLGGKDGWKPYTK